MFRDPLSMTTATMAAPVFTAPRTPIHRSRCVVRPAAPQDPVARLVAAIRAVAENRST